MTQKKRLADLLCKCGFPTLWNTKYEDFQTAVEEIAEKLLDNGVIVPPCKVGDTVYVLDNYGIVKVFITEYTLTDGGGQYYLGDCLDVDMEIGFSNSDIGEKVFATREEAEQALKYMQTKG